MKNFRFTGAALCATALLALPQAAAAAVWTTTYQGVVTAGSDIGTFGLGCLTCINGGQLDGLAFTAVFITDSAAAGATSVAGAHSLTVGGPGVVSASLTINGATLFLGGASGSQVLFDDGSVQTAAHAAGRHDQSISIIDDPEFGPMIFGYEYVANLSLGVTGQGDGNFNSLPPGMIGTGSLSEHLDTFSGLIGASGDSGADLLVTSVDMSVSVPEPQAWALMILGFGATGGWLRRRRAVAAT
jgi:hypothetical protein